MQAVGLGSADGAINDGVSESIKATVFDYTVANPLATVLVDASGNAVIPITAVTGLNTGRQTVTTAGTRIALASSTTCKSVIITAETDNTGVIVVGGSGVIASLATRQGTPLYALGSVCFEVDDLADVFIDSTVNTDGVTYTYFT